ncbi:MAG: acyl carrier protein [Cellvibrionaceae bacterium]|jgi:acyl carrier protein
MMLLKNEVRTDLVKIFKECSLCDENEFTDNQPLNDLFDSMTRIEILNEIDDKYELNVGFEKIIDLNTFDDVVNFIFEKVAQPV